MEKVINKPVLIKPSLYQVSSLKIAKMAINKLKNLSQHQHARHIAKSITGQTTVEQAYEITSKYISWVNRYE